jgi:hypothetical protein
MLSVLAVSRLVAALLLTALAFTTITASGSFATLLRLPASLAFLRLGLHPYYRIGPANAEETLVRLLDDFNFR